MADIRFLRIPLYKLLYIEDLDQFRGLSDEEMGALRNEYTEEEMAAIKGAVAWAVANPAYDFSSMLPDVRYNNTEIYDFLCALHSSIENA